MAESRQAVLTGGCQCGAIRYALYAQPERVHFCHCRMCQKASGNLFGTGAPIRLKDFAWTRGTPPAFRSSTIGTRHFCPNCGTPLSFRYEGNDWISPTLGSLDRPQDVPPAHRAVRDRQHPGEDDVEAVALLALAHDRGTRCDLLALHLLRQLRERLAREAREQLDPRELVRCRGRARHYSSGSPGADSRRARFRCSSGS